MKKIVITIFMFLLAIFLIGCEDYEDIKPDISEFGFWDGNYIYFGNTRCKTTGEDEEYLVETIIYNDTKYQVEQLMSYEYVDDTIYMVMYFTSSDEIQLDEELNNSTDYSIIVLVEYNIVTKKYNILCDLANETYVIDRIFKGEYIFLESTNYTIRYSLSTGEVTKFSYKVLSYYDDFILAEQNKVLFYNKYYEDELTIICSYEGNLTYKLVNKNNKKYLLMNTYEFVKSNLYYNSLSIYDFQTKKLNNIITFNDQKELMIVNEDYVMFYESKDYEYVSSIKEYGSFLHEVLTYSLNVNNVLYKVNYDSYNIEKIYEFENKDTDYTYGIIDNNKYIANSEKVKRGSQLIPGDVKEKRVQLDLTTFEISTIKKVKNNKQNVITRDSIKVGEYEYYFKNIKITPLIGGNYAYFLYRADTSGNITIMQFFAYDEYSMYKGVRYSELFAIWYGKNTNINDIMILNY